MRPLRSRLPKLDALQTVAITACRHEVTLAVRTTKSYWNHMVYLHGGVKPATVTASATVTNKDLIPRRIRDMLAHWSLGTSDVGYDSEDPAILDQGLPWDEASVGHPLGLFVRNCRQRA